MIWQSIELPIRMNRVVLADNINFHFSYFGFEWIPRIPHDTVPILFFALGVCAVFITIGLKYQYAMAGHFVIFTYLMLYDSTLWQNHYYLTSLLSLILIFMPLSGQFSVDAVRKKVTVAPYWTLFLLRFQIAVVYIYGGVAKFFPDWLHCKPMIYGMNNPDFFLSIFNFGMESLNEPVACVLSYSALFLDLLIVPFLLIRKTHLIALCFGVSFHVLNFLSFNALSFDGGIGAFPTFMIGATLLFFSPDFPIKWIKKIRSLRYSLSHT